jgi:dTDP-4-dehydrorhamnose 3,5-epimerase
MSALPVEARATTLPGVHLVIPTVYPDDRGYFKELYSERYYPVLGMTAEFVQDSMSFSRHNVVRGMHGDWRMVKLIQVVRGRIFDVLVDMRPDSPSYGKWEGFELSEHNHHQLYVPPGIAHGFVALEPEVACLYKYSALYDPSKEFFVRWNDPRIGIEWPLVGEPILSERDRNVPLLA